MQGYNISVTKEILNVRHDTHRNDTQLYNTEQNETQHNIEQHDIQYNIKTATLGITKFSIIWHNR